MVTVNVRWNRCRKAMVFDVKTRSEAKMHWNVSPEGKKWNSGPTEGKSQVSEGTLKADLGVKLGDLFDFNKLWIESKEPQAAEIRKAVNRLAKLIEALEPKTNRGDPVKGWEGVCWYRNLLPLVKTDTEKRLLERCKSVDRMSGEEWVRLETVLRVGGWELGDLYESKPAKPEVKTITRTGRAARPAKTSETKTVKEENWELWFSCDAVNFAK